MMTGSNHGSALRRLLGGVSVPLYSLSQIGIHVHDAVAVEHEVAHEVAMAADIAHNRVVGVSVQVLIALLGGVQPEIWNRNPGHEEVGVAWSLVQAVAAYRHEIRQRRSPQVTVQRSKDRRKITAGRGQRRVPLFVGVAVPGAVGMAQEAQLPSPGLARDVDIQSPRDEGGARRQLVIKAVGNGVSPELSPGS